MSGGRLLTLQDLDAAEPRAEESARPDRTFDLTLSSGMMSDAWTIDGQAYPSTEPLVIHERERVRVRMTNRSMMTHPMHLHGHFFRVGRAPLSLLGFSVVLAACLGPRRATTWTLEPSIEPQSSGTDALLIGTSVVNDSVIWVSGSEGTWLRTTNGGATWQGGTVPGADSLELRDVHAFDAENAFLLSIGEGDQSRIYRTSDAGETWTLVFRNDEPRAFFDCFDFWDNEHGLAFSDSFDGSFLLIETTDGGATWTRIPADRLPPARDGEGAFAASGTCLVVQGDATAWIGTGASDGGARVLRTTDRGRTWSVAETPIVKGGSAGIASLAFRDERHGAALGGDIADPDSPSDNVALTRDGGETWTLGGRPTFTGAVYGSSWVPGAPDPTLVAVGPKGVSYSTDGGVGWAALDTRNHWGVAFASPDRGWAVGPEGRISRVRLYRRR